MKREFGIQMLWAVADRLLLVAVFVLLGVVWYATGRADAAADQWAQQGTTSPRAGLWQRPSTSGKAVDGLRVSAGRSRMSDIARSMVESGWERIPCSPAMDMREDGKTYEILVSLPEGVSQESVRVTTAGSVLTLAMRNVENSQTYLRRVRLPCGVDRADRVQSVVSNNMLRVRIQPAGER